MDVSPQIFVDALQEPSALLGIDGETLFTNAAWREAEIGAPGAGGAALGDVLAAITTGEPRATRCYATGAWHVQRRFRLEAAVLLGESVLVRRIDTTEACRSDGDVARLSARLCALLEATEDAVITIDPSGVVLDANRSLTGLLGYEQAEVVGCDLGMLMTGRDRDAHAGFVESFLTTGEARVIGRERIVEARRKDGGLVPVRLTVREARAGDERLFVGVLRDVSETRAACDERDRNAAVFALALDAGRLGFFDIDLDDLSVRADERFRAVFGLDADAAIAGPDVARRMASEEVDRIAGILAQTATGAEIDFETRLSPTEEPTRIARSVAIRGRVIECGGVRHVMGVVADITERREVEEQRLREERDGYVIREMRHRVKNLFTMVGAILNLSLRGRSEAMAYKRVVEERLAALAASQARLAESGWRSGSLEEIVERELEPFRERRHAVSIDSCRLDISGHAAQILSMIIHELTTNAAKHGALSSPDGRVHISCRHEAGELVLDWREEGGPVVSEPTHRGFGTTVIGRMAQRFLGAETEARFEPDGFRYRLGIPENEILQ